MLACGEQCLDDFAVQEIRDDDADDIDRGVVGDGTPLDIVTLEPIARGSLRAEFDVDVSDRDQVDLGECRLVDSRSCAVGGGMGFSRHACADDSDAE